MLAASSPGSKLLFSCTKCKLNVLVFEAVSKTLIGFVHLGTYASSLVIAICAVCQLIQEERAQKYILFYMSLTSYLKKLSFCIPSGSPNMLKVISFPRFAEIGSETFLDLTRQQVNEKFSHLPFGDRKIISNFWNESKKHQGTRQTVSTNCLSYEIEKDKHVLFLIKLVFLMNGMLEANIRKVSRFEKGL